MPLHENRFAKRMELLTAYQKAIEDYAAAIQALDQGRGMDDYLILERIARDAHVKCEEARKAVTAQRLNT